MLVIEIAAGVILAYLAIKFWRAAIGVALLALLAIVGFVWWIAVKDGNPTALKAWAFTGEYGPIFVVIIVVAFLKELSKALDRWSIEHPESQAAARLVRIRNAITPSDWKAKKP